ncbi:MAG TPA: hypothetical protein PK691_11445 [Thermomicrobiales bacterium]|nr:hypothetical protein [Thermomicrobiales bacterium]HRA48332.1 hypothetical protein [Thermomicrobiales bacterium]
MNERAFGDAPLEQPFATERALRKSTRLWYRSAPATDQPAIAMSEAYRARTTGLLAPGLFNADATGSDHITSNEVTPFN